MSAVAVSLSFIEYTKRTRACDIVRSVSRGAYNTMMGTIRAFIAGAPVVNDVPFWGVDLGDTNGDWAVVYEVRPVNDSPEGEPVIDADACGWKWYEVEYLKMGDAVPLRSTVQAGSAAMAWSTVVRLVANGDAIAWKLVSIRVSDLTHIM